MSLLLSGGTVVELDPPRVRKADVWVDGPTIRSVGAAAGAATRIDCSGCVVLPGLVVGHTHLYGTLARGMPAPPQAPRGFVEILERVWWKLDKALEARAIADSASAGAIEALRSGVTTIVDHHASPRAVDGSLDLVAGAVNAVGPRLIGCYEVSDRDGVAVRDAGLRENERFARAERPLARAFIGAHASFTLSAETLERCADVCARTKLGLHVHVAEDAADQANSLATHGVRVVERLRRAGVLNDRALLAHCVHLGAAEIEAVRAAGATVAHNPRSNMNNAVGYAPVGALASQMVLGTDGIGADLFEEARAAFVRGREAGAVVSPIEIAAMVSRSSALASRSFGMPLGRIEPGAAADLVVLDYDPPTPLEADNLAGHFVFGMSVRHVRDVIIAGEARLRDRRVLSVDEPALLARARETARSLWQRI